MLAPVERTNVATDETKRRECALRIWRESTDPRGTGVETYLKHRRLALDECLVRTIRFHPNCPLRDDNGQRVFGPAMVCAMRNIEAMVAHIVSGGDDRLEAIDNERFVSAIHRTGLTDDGRKRFAKRQMLGVAKGSAVMLDDIVSVFDAGRVVGGEGVETALSQRQIGDWPTWALGSTSNFKNLPVAHGIWRLVICGENDDASRNAVDECASRWNAAGRDVVIIWQPHGVKDSNDLINGGRND